VTVTLYGTREVGSEWAITNFTKCTTDSDAYASIVSSLHIFEQVTCVSCQACQRIRTGCGKTEIG
jgi:hypothetical protein